MPRPFYARSIETATDELQLLEALRTNRQKRTAQRRFIVEGVRNIDAALAAAWPISSVLAPIGGEPSRWARDVIDRTDAERIALAPELFDRLTDRDERPELLLVAEIPERTLGDLPRRDDLVVIVLDRIASPGNLGTIIRTSDALGAHAVVTVGHSAHAYDPRAVRASTGSLFALPVVPVAGPAELASFFEQRALMVVATDEGAELDIADATLRVPCALLFGNETAGLSRALLELADTTVRISIAGTASSLNVAAAHAIVVHELAKRAP
ncbi:MAG: rRNA (uridine2479-2-O)-methyltransferase [Actinomycetota bacterium]|jgi:TrmH family RNA methyltransferase|nr:rRNA (uridine2479-2-O)-methyltransferase [Actinomycetota bacterium]